MQGNLSAKRSLLMSKSGHPFLKSLLVLCFTSAYVMFSAIMMITPAMAEPAMYNALWSRPGVDSLERGQEIVTRNGHYQLKMQNDGNLVLYQNVNPQLFRVCWAKYGGHRLLMQTDGNVVFYNSSNKKVWASDTVQATSPSTFLELIMQDDGNLVAYRTDIVNGVRYTNPIWASNTQYCGHIF